MTNLKAERVSINTKPLGSNCPHCGGIEFEHHVFVECREYEAERQESVKQCQAKVLKWLDDCDDEVKTIANNFTFNLFHDSDIWPGGRTRYYMDHDEVVRENKRRNELDGKNVNRGGGNSERMDVSGAEIEQYGGKEAMRRTDD